MGIRKYFNELAAHTGPCWNRFWFEPTDPFALCVLRGMIGALALVWQLSFTPDLMRWFGPRGWFDAGVLDQWLTSESTLGVSGRLSYLYTNVPATLWGAHVVGALILLAFTLGLFTRITAVLSFCVLLAYIHRAPFLCSVTELVITMVVGYLCLAPCGRFFSLDARWRPPTRIGPSAWATVARRLIQVHLVMLYAIMVLSKLGAATWWNGEAIWWLMAQPASSRFSPSFLRNVPVVLNLWTYAILLSEFAFALLVWNRWLRPLVLGFATLSWLSLVFATGNLALPLTMIIANLVFIPSAFWRELFAASKSDAAAEPG